MKKPPRSRVSIPSVAWRDGRPRFVPGAAQRRMGYKGQDLKTSTGAWMTFEQASAWSQEHEREVERRRSAKAQTGRLPPRPRSRVVTVASLFESWIAHCRRRSEGAGAQDDGRRRAKKLSPVTLAGYVKLQRALEDDASDLFNAPVAAITKPILFGLYEQIAAKRGLASAAAMMRAISAAISYGMRRGMAPFEANPAHNLGMDMPEPRVRVAEPDEISHLIHAADALGRPEIGDSIMLGVWTGQRQSDRLALVSGDLTRGRRIFRQKKTGAIVAVPQKAALEETLQAAAARREDQVKAGGQRHPEILIDERQAAPWRSSHYSHVFLAIRIAATAGVFERDGQRVCPAEGTAARAVAKYLQGIRGLTAAEARAWPAPGPAQWIIAPMPELEGFRDQDLRDTAVTWLARAGSTIPEICSITGHSLQSATRILEHYLAMHPELADHAMNKLEAWHENENRTHETKSSHETVSRRRTFSSRS